MDIDFYCTFTIFIGATPAQPDETQLPRQADAGRDGDEDSRNPVKSRNPVSRPSGKPPHKLPQVHAARHGSSAGRTPRSNFLKLWVKPQSTSINQSNPL
ncbi:MAG: hypothetical protein FWC66_10285 [Oscillospiraceae bacterium]|nr:hypothetical protein [Oscillospiraceae bacterium]